MKKLFFLILSAACLAVPAFANIPARVTNAFHARYSTATNVEWKHGLGKYKASFVMDDCRYEAKFDRHGRWVESEKMMQGDRLPRMVRNSLHRSKYRGWEIRSSYVEYSLNKRPRYHVEAVRGDYKKRLEFNENGQLING